MVLKPLNNDEIEANESAQWGFFGPFYQGEFRHFRNAISGAICDIWFYVYDPQISG